MKISDAKIWLTKKVLRENELFQDLDDQILDALIAQANVKLLSEHDILYHKGEEANDTFCIIIFGSVNVVGDSGQVLTVLKRGKIMGEIGVIGMQHRRSADVVALEPTSILEWRFSDVKDQSPELIKRLQNLAFMHLRNGRK